LLWWVAGASQPTCGGLVVAVVGWLARRSKSVWAWVCSGRSAEAWRPTYWGLVTALVSGAGASRATCWGLGTALVGQPAAGDLLGASALLWSLGRRVATSPLITR